MKRIAYLDLDDICTCQSSLLLVFALQFSTSIITPCQLNSRHQKPGSNESKSVEDRF